MGKSTISKSMPTIAPRDHVAPETPLSERPLVPKSHAASKYRIRRCRFPFSQTTHR
jgi:NTE family protein